MGDKTEGNWLTRFWRGFVLAPLRQADDEARAIINGTNAAAAGRKALTVLVLTALLLTLQFYFCKPDGLWRTVDSLRVLPGGQRFYDYVMSLGSPSSHSEEIPWLRHWAIGTICCYFVIPALVIKLVFRERLSDYGLKLRGAFTDGWVYLVMAAIMAPLVLLVSLDAHFQMTYPFLYVPRGEPLWPTFWIWEGMYAVQFLALEFFFRGFLLHGLRPRFGSYAIPVMMVPYCMIHFGKPLPETLASILAGLALGFMSVRTRSVLLGAAIHISVALSMDFASLWRKGYFG
jgi:membrane protease YdiL (CAAX protease family)